MKKLALIAFLAISIISCESVNNHEATETIDTQAVNLDTFHVSQPTDSAKAKDSVSAPMESTSLQVSK